MEQQLPQQHPAGNNGWQQQPREPTPSDRVDQPPAQLEEQQPSKPSAAAGPPSGQPPFPAADPTTHEDSFSNNDTKAASVQPPVTPNNKKADRKKGKKAGEDKKKGKGQQQQQKPNNNGSSDQKYIPGMEGTVRPDEPDQYADDEANLAQAEALTRLKVISNFKTVKKRPDLCSHPQDTNSQNFDCVINNSPALFNKSLTRCEFP